MQIMATVFGFKSAYSHGSAWNTISFLFGVLQLAASVGLPYLVCCLKRSADSSFLQPFADLDLPLAASPTSISTSSRRHACFPAASGGAHWLLSAGAALWLMRVRQVHILVLLDDGAATSPLGHRRRFHPTGVGVVLRDSTAIAHQRKPREQKLAPWLHVQGFDPGL